jgi:DNA-binding transcriptional ArsR family regulator
VNRSGTVATFWALSDPLRLDILDHIADGSRATVTQLAEALPVTRQAVARHLRTLEDAGLIVGEQEGREQHYRIDPAPLDAAGRWLAKRAAAWERTLDRLAAYVESDAMDE